MKTIIISILFTAIFTMNSIAKEKPEIVYVFDPLCGWCYGFSPVILKAWETYKDEIDFKVIPGGMITGDRIAQIGTMAEFLKKATTTVSQRTGAEFSKKFLDTILTEGTHILTSVEPSIAIAVYSSYAPENLMPFIDALHKEIYVRGIKMDKPEDYEHIALKFGIEPSEFIKNMKLDIYKKKAFDLFDKSSEYGVESYPTLLYKNANTVQVLAKGFLEWHKLKILLNDILSSR